MLSLGENIHDVIEICDEDMEPSLGLSLSESGAQHVAVQRLSLSQYSYEEVYITLD